MKMGRRLWLSARALVLNSGSFEPLAIRDRRRVNGGRRPHVSIYFREESFHMFGHNGHARTIPLSRSAIPVRQLLSNSIFLIKGDAFRLAWNRIVLRASISNLRLHDLRHEAISRFFEMGLTVPEVAAISGHRDLTMLFRYAHAQSQSILTKLDQHQRKAS
jgi:integrase